MVPRGVFERFGRQVNQTSASPNRNADLKLNGMVYDKNPRADVRRSAVTTQFVISVAELNRAQHHCKADGLFKQKQAWFSELPIGNTAQLLPRRNLA